MSRVFKARMILYAAYGTPIIHEDGSVNNHPHWFELAKENHVANFVNQFRIDTIRSRFGTNSIYSEQV